MKTTALQRGATGAALALALVAWTASVRAQEIIVGQIGPFTVIPVPDAPEINQGITAYINEANKLGIRGRKISFFEADDRYSADGFVDEFNKALLKKPVALISPIG